jgi:hypothetical protein
MNLARKSHNIFHAMFSAVIGRIEMPQCSDRLLPGECYLRRGLVGMGISLLCDTATTRGLAGLFVSDVR